MEIPTNYAQANLIFTGDAAPTGAQITLGFNVELYAGDPDDLAGDIGLAWIDASIDHLQSDTIVMSEILVKFGPNSIGPSASVPVSIPGTEAGAACPPNTAALIRKITGFGGRSGRGRLYLPAIPEGQIDQSGVLSSTWVNDLTSNFEAFRADLNGQGAVATLLHGEDSPVSTPMPITAFAAAARVATQRRRLRR